MKQLVQKLKDGDMDVAEVAVPVIGLGTVLVRNHFSLISAGTEGSTVSTARKSLIGKAKERPQQVKQVLDTLKQQGPVQTYRAVMKKLDSYSPLGYSSAGEVIAVAPDVKGFVVGDLVACAGAGYANHAEVSSVPENLCVKLPPDADLSKAAYNTLGAIALQGIRQADHRIGETCVVIGLGLLGQLTCLMLRASGVKVIGLDIDQNMVDLATKHCADVAFVSSAPGILDAVLQMTDGIGADSVIITAATSSLEPINQAGELLRKCGTAVIVGSVPTGFDREPHFYKKELSLKMSCSYGPGRYDINYEEKGEDYPAAYVRWTENRNMKAFQELLHSGKIHIDYLTTHRYKLEDALEAYDLIVNKTERFIGMMIEYDVDHPLSQKPIYITSQSLRPNNGVDGIGFIGAGSYAMSHLLPNIVKKDKVEMTGVLTSSGTSSRSVAEKYSFNYVTSDEKDLYKDEATNTIFIATRHDSHASYVLNSIKAGKNVFVEKPLCLTEEELNEIALIVRQTENPPVLMIGFNRRFAPLAKEIKAKISKGPMSMLYRVNAGAIPANSWIQDSDIGGGRIIGEICHFIDFLMFMCDSLPKSLSASAMTDASSLEDTLNINITFENGSIATIAYYANGSKSLAKEYIEIFSAGTTAILKDFKELEIYGKGKPYKKKLINQDKGQKDMVDAFLDATGNEQVMPISFEETFITTLSTFKIIESIRNNQIVSLGK